MFNALHSRARFRELGLARGFTLIELMIAVAVVAVIVALALPSFKGSVQKSRRADAIAAFAGVQQAQERWRGNNPAYTNILGNLGVTSPQLYTLSLDTPAGGSLTTGYVIVAEGTGSQADDRACKRMSVQMVNGNVGYGACESCTTFTYGPTNPCFNR